MFNRFCLTISIPGALTADHVAKFIAPSDCTLVHVSAACTTQNATLTIGHSDNDDSCLDAAAVTADAPAEFELADFVDAAYPRISDGDVILVTVGHGSNCVNFTAVLTFLEG